MSEQKKGFIRSVVNLLKRKTTSTGSLVLWGGDRPRPRAARALSLMLSKLGPHLCHPAMTIAIAIHCGHCPTGTQLSHPSTSRIPPLTDNTILSHVLLADPAFTSSTIRPLMPISCTAPLGVGRHEEKRDAETLPSTLYHPIHRPLTSRSS